MNNSWIDLDPEDTHNMLVSLVGHRFGSRPEDRLDEIRAARYSYAEGFIKLAGINKKHTVLDLGSGCGFGTSAIARRAGRVLACDISPAFLTYASRECAGLDNIEFRQTNIRDLSGIAPESVDVVISMSVFIHLNIYDIYCYFEEFRKILKQGGRVTFDFADMSRLFNRWRPYTNNALFREHAGHYRDDPNSHSALMRWNTARGISGVAREAGFKRLKRRGHCLLFAMI